MSARSSICRRLAVLLLAAIAPGAGVFADDNPFALSLGGGGGRNAPLLATDGKQLYQHVCQACHMSEGQGARLGPAAYPALAANARLAARTYPAMLVVNGLGAMPAFGSQMNDEQVAALVNYVRGAFGNSYGDRVTSAEVAALRPSGQQAPTELRGR